MEVIPKSTSRGSDSGLSRRRRVDIAELQAAGAINTRIGSIILSEPMIRQMLADWLTEQTRYLLVRFRQIGNSSMEFGKTVSGMRAPLALIEWLTFGFLARRSE